VFPPFSLSFSIYSPAKAPALLCGCGMLCGSDDVWYHGNNSVIDRIHGGGEITTVMRILSLFDVLF
jgi:hypothetical protein